MWHRRRTIAQMEGEAAEKAINESLLREILLKRNEEIDQIERAISEATERQAREHHKDRLRYLNTKAYISDQFKAAKREARTHRAVILIGTVTLLFLLIIIEMMR